MGILNVTPDSFHDGGRYLAPEQARQRLAQLAAGGADIIDIGGMSSRPGHTPLDAQTETERVLPVIAACAAACALPISVDTDKVEVAAAALEAGASIINYSGGLLDAAVFRLAAKSGAPMIVMHRGGAGHSGDIVNTVEEFFRAAIGFAREQGLNEDRLILDPGLGFDKNAEEDILLMRAIPRFAAFMRPLLYGFSHKRFIAALSGETPGIAPLGNLAAIAFAAEQGAHILRLHDIAESRAFFDAYSGLKGWGKNG